MPTKKSKSNSEPRLQDRVAAIEVFENTIIATVYGPDGPIRKIVEPADVIRYFMPNQVGVAWSDFRGRLVAAGTGPDGLQHVLVMRKAKRTRITVQIGQRIHKPWIRVPNLLAELAGDGRAWTRLCRVFAFHGSLTDRTNLYVAPFPNMHNDATVCMGSVAIEPVKGVSAATAFERVFIESTFTDHILGGPMKSKKNYRNIWHAIKKTKGKVPLSELKKVTTYGELITQHP